MENDQQGQLDEGRGPHAERAPGGLGLFIVRKTMDAVAYRRDGDRNLLTLTKRLAP